MEKCRVHFGERALNEAVFHCWCLPELDSTGLGVSNREENLETEETAIVH